MDKKKLELITLVVITVVVIAFTMFTFVKPLESTSTLPLTNIIVILGLLTYMAFSVVSFIRFDGRIKQLKERLSQTETKLEETKSNLEKKINEVQTLNASLNEAQELLAEKEKEIEKMKEEQAQ